MPGDQAVHPLAFGSIPFRRAVDDTHPHSPMYTGYLPRRTNRSRGRRNCLRHRGRVRNSPVFFMGHPQLAQRIPDTVAGNVEMPRPFRLSAINMDLHMAAHLFPIQLARPARAGTLVDPAARFEPAVHARRINLEPPSRFGPAASTANKLHNPLSQIS